jgi:two-component system sensor kinase
VAVRLHDGIAQELFALKLGLDELQGKTRKRSAENRLCTELNAALVRCMEDTRQIANELRPVALAKFGVAVAIGEHARAISRHLNLVIAVHADVPVPMLQESVQLLLFRAAQEALANVAKHAGATRVDIRLYEDDGITLAVADDGIGIAEGALQKPRSMGLLGLQERFEALGGSITVTRNQPVGTRVSFHLPALGDEALTVAFAEVGTRPAVSPRAP